MRIIYITGMIPARMGNGTEIATQMIIQALESLGHEVTVAGFLRPDDDLPSKSRQIVLGRIPIEFASASGLQKLKWVMLSICKNEPLSVAKFRHDPAYDALERELKMGYDVALVDKPQTFEVFKKELSGIPTSVVWHAIEHITYAGVAKDERHLRRALYIRESTQTKNMEVAALGQVQHVFALTANDAGKIRQLGYGGPIDIIPLAVPSSEEQAVGATDYQYDIGLLGNWTWSANTTGLTWFLKEVREILPENLSIAVAGAASASILPAVSSVQRIGFVENARRFLGSCRVVAIPLLAGTGVSMKVLEAACEGWPTVTTSIGARGIDALPDNITIADTPASFAAALQEKLNTDVCTRRELRMRGAEWIEERQNLLRSAIESGLKHLRESTTVS